MFKARLGRLFSRKLPQAQEQNTEHCRIASILVNLTRLHCQTLTAYNHKMDFPCFVKELIKINECEDRTALYRKLGGEESLGVSIETFHRAAKGEAVPSASLVERIFPHVPPHLRSQFLLSYFRSLFQNENVTSNEILALLEQKLLFSKDDKIEIWSDEHQVLSEEQLDYLLANDDGYRCYRAILTNFWVPTTFLSGHEATIKELQTLKLIKPSEKGRLAVECLSYRIPSLDIDKNTPPHLLEKAYRYMQKALSFYYEVPRNSPANTSDQTTARAFNDDYRQHLRFQSLPATRSDAEVAFRVLEELRTWLYQRCPNANEKPDPNKYVALIGLYFLKELNLNDLFTHIPQGGTSEK